MNLATPVIKTDECDQKIEEIIQRLELEIVRQHTNAPLRMCGHMVFNSHASDVFDYFTDSELMVSWFPTLTQIRLNHAKSCSAGKLDVGSIRTCDMQGMGALKERVLHWDTPQAFAYTASNWMIPIKNHLGLVSVTPISKNTSLVIWHHYFDFTGLIIRFIFPSMMVFLMNKGIRSLVNRIGGDGGKMRINKPT